MAAPPRAHVSHRASRVTARLAAGGDAEAVSALVGIAGERGEVAELRRPAETGSGHAAELVNDLTGD